MAKIKWKPKAVIEAEKLKEIKAQKFKGRDFKSLSSKEKDELLEGIAVQLGLVKDL
jgi:alkyl hydroperoxide reductase subunit AhpF